MFFIFYLPTFVVVVVIIPGAFFPSGILMIRIPLCCVIGHGCHEDNCNMSVGR